jgi:hypothetical protein
MHRLVVEHTSGWLGENRHLIGDSERLYKTNEAQIDAPKLWPRLSRLPPT